MHCVLDLKILEVFFSGHLTLVHVGFVDGRWPLAFCIYILSLMLWSKKVVSDRHTHLDTTCSLKRPFRKVFLQKKIAKVF